MRFIAALTLCLCWLPGTAAALEATTLRLENGLSAVVVEDHRAPVVVHSIWYKVGAADETPGKTGLAHLLEHMMFKGTKTVPEGQFSEIISRLGGQQNAFTTRDYTGYYQKIARANLARAMELEADRMVNLSFSNSAFLTERDVVLEERRMRTDSKPTGRFFEKFSRHHYRVSPYGVPTIGWREDIESLTAADARAWYKKYYIPANAVVILAGDISPAEAQPLLEKYYGEISARPLPAKEALAPEPPFQEPRRLEEVDPEVREPFLYRLYRVPGTFTPAEESLEKRVERSLAFSLAAHVLGGSATSHLYNRLVRERGLATAVSASYTGVTRNEGSFDLFAQPAPGTNLKTLEKAMDEELATFLTQGVNADELGRAKTAFLAAEIYGRDNVFATVYGLGPWLMAGGTTETYDLWQEKIAAVTPEDIATALRLLDITQSTTGLLAGSGEALR